MNLTNCWKRILGDSMKDLDNIIVFENISKKFDEFYAIKDISFSIEKNTITGLIGSNGAGKTTALKCMLNYYNDYSGNIKIFGIDSTNIIDSDNIISYIPDKPVYYDELTVMEHIEFISVIYNTENSIEYFIDKLELSRHLNKFPYELSKGNLRKLVIISALLRKYEILIADEPFEGLDPKQIKILRDLFLELKNNGKTIIISTHLLSIIEPICDSYIMLNNGELLSSGNIDDILNSKKINTLEELYMFILEKGNKNED